LAFSLGRSSVPPRNRDACARVLGISHWRILGRVLVFRETSLFTRQVVQKLTDSEYLELQAALVLQPELGDLIPDSGGLRKLRWGESRRGKGKRGGVRVIYYGTHLNYSSTFWSCTQKPIETTLRLKRGRRCAS